MVRPDSTGFKVRKREREFNIPQPFNIVSRIFLNGPGKPLAVYGSSLLASIELVLPLRVYFVSDLILRTAMQTMEIQAPFLLHGTDTSSFTKEPPVFLQCSTILAGAQG